MIDVPDKKDPQPGSASRSNRQVIACTCTKHGTPGFTNLVVSKLDGSIELDPHATGACVIRLNDDAAMVLRDALTEWLS
ncbi:MAG: hypothetical protein M3460_07620 [Actinomycetota bacterium]|nr:hypothetical protein [Actinomycetota bacterium]